MNVQGETERIEILERRLRIDPARTSDIPWDDYNYKTCRKKYGRQLRCSAARTRQVLRMMVPVAVAIPVAVLIARHPDYRMSRKLLARRRRIPHDPIWQLPRRFLLVVKHRPPLDRQTQRLTRLQPCHCIPRGTLHHIAHPFRRLKFKLLFGHRVSGSIPL